VANLHPCTRTPHADQESIPRLRELCECARGLRTLELGEREVAVVAGGPGEEVGDEEDERVHVPRHHRVGPQQRPRARAAPVLHEPPLVVAAAASVPPLHRSSNLACLDVDNRHLRNREEEEHQQQRSVLHTHTHRWPREKSINKNWKKKELRTRKSLMRLVRYVRLARLTSPSSSDPPRKKTMCFFALKHRLPLSLSLKKRLLRTCSWLALLGKTNRRRFILRLALTTHVSAAVMWQSVTNC
jgi:hypothetical protein